MKTIERYKRLPEDIYNTFDEMTDEAYELFVAKSMMLLSILTGNV
jgi:hypothetical protein